MWLFRSSPYIFDYTEQIIIKSLVSQSRFDLKVSHLSKLSHSPQNELFINYASVLGKSKHKIDG